MKFKYNFRVLASLTLRATITQFDTIPYVEHELEGMDKKHRHAIEHFDFEKVSDEVVVERVVAETRNDLRKRIMQVYKRFHPNPIVVYADAFEVDSFITSTPYRSWIPWALGEQVLFRNQKVLCRIIGRDSHALYRFGRYCIERHKFEGPFASDFNYPRNRVFRRMSSWA
jgi:hypothetical protein